MPSRLIYRYDAILLGTLAVIIPLGLLMLASSAITLSEKQFGNPFHYLLQQLIYWALSLSVSAGIVLFRMQNWQRYSHHLLIATLILLLLILVPGLGKHVNGSTRWLSLGGLNLQISEFAKLIAIIYLANYCAQRSLLNNKMIDFLKPLAIIGCICALLICQPDFGTATVILLTSLITLFLAGVRITQFCALLCFIGAILLSVAVAAPYRWLRLTSFLNPWANQFDSGYQLTQSLIAMGRGGFSGVGLGESIQKLFYLPETHTDFLFAVITEELGLIGACLVLLLFALLVWRALKLGRRCFLVQHFFNAYCAYGIALSFALQVAIHVGVNAGILPTKGLTLPFMSYGGNSLMVSSMMIALLLRIDYELQKNSAH
jgi:cell division protein FtsW